MSDNFDHIHPLDPGRKPRGYWTYARCKQAAEECGAVKLSDWKNKHTGSLQGATINGWHLQIAEELGWNYMKRDVYWTKERCLEDIKNHGVDSLIDWKTRRPNSYAAAVRGKFQRELAKELGWDTLALANSWTYEKCKYHAVACGAVRLIAWKKLHGASYQQAVVKGWARKIAEELGWETKTLDHSWTYEKCKQAAIDSGANSIIRWREHNSASVQAATAQKWTRKIAEELGWPVIQVPAGHWTFERCQEVAASLGVSSLSEWSKTSAGSYIAACKNKWQIQIAKGLGWDVNVHDDSKVDTVLYWYTDGEYIYIGETCSPDSRHNNHYTGFGGSIVYDYIDFDVDPEYLMNKRGSDFRFMDGFTARRAERRMIKCAANKGYKVLNKGHNPQWDGTRFSWEDPLEEAA